MAGFEVPQGTWNPMELREFNVLRWWIPSATYPAYRMLGVKYIAVPKGAPPGGEGIWPVFVEDPTIDVHLHTGALPRVWLVYRTEIVHHYGEALKRVLDESFRPEEIAVVQNGPRLNGEGQGRIEVARYSPDEVILAVETDAPALPDQRRLPGRGGAPGTSPGDVAVPAGEPADRPVDDRGRRLNEFLPLGSNPTRALRAEPLPVHTRPEDPHLPHMKKHTSSLRALQNRIKVDDLFLGGAHEVVSGGNPPLSDPEDRGGIAGAADLPSERSSPGSGISRPCPSLFPRPDLQRQRSHPLPLGLHEPGMGSL
jgi:hypothetical protein